MELTETEEAPTKEVAASPTEDSNAKPRKRRNPFQSTKEERERRQKKRARIIVRNISFKATEESLRTHFAQWGAVDELNLLKRPDGKLVGCAFVQYALVNQATKAILKGNNGDFLGRPLIIDWAQGKDEYIARKAERTEPPEKKPKAEGKVDEKLKEEDEVKDEEAEIKSESDDDEGSESGQDEGDESGSAADDDSEEEEEEEKAVKSEEDDSEDDEDEDDAKPKKNIEKVMPEKRISNDVVEGCTVFIKNVPFDATDNDLRKACRKFGLLHYAIINRERLSGHSKGTAFVKFKTKESADLCLQSGTEFRLMDQPLDPFPALSRDEVGAKNAEKGKSEEGKDSRNLYLAREGLIMAGSKAADDVSTSDMTKRHKLEQIKTQVLKNLNRFVSRNRLSIHNLPLGYDNEKLRQLAVAHAGLRPHECRVMRENQITPEHPKGKSKGFGFLSFTTHKEALTALRKLNNNPKIFGPQHRPIVAFSIEDRAVHQIKEKRAEKSKLNNPTYQKKLERRKELRRQRQAGKGQKPPMKAPQGENKTKLRVHLKKLEESRSNAGKKQKATQDPPLAEDKYVGTAAKPGTALKMRSNKKIREQAKEHQKRVRANKRKDKQNKLKQIHSAARKSVDRPKQKRKVEKDDLTPLVNKYKKMIEGAPTAAKTKKPKRTKWYAE